MTRLYPQSFLSVSDYKFEPDTGEVAGLQEDLENLKTLIESDTTEDAAVMRAETVVDLFNMEWLHDSVEMDDAYLDQIGLLLSSAREDVMTLMVRENYNETTKEWLALTSYNLINAEIKLARLSESNWASRRELDHEFRRMHQDLANSIDHFNTFFERRVSLGSEQ
ncbi:hypothetical protein ACTWQB_00550 [Piscibacillus sp. B03]|uniref:hypothetical protein n=1 Tax=Piscibacillus sp. B03 TaxID=3457430 RepID=UPI003FCDB453